MPSVYACACAGTGMGRWEVSSSSTTPHLASIASLTSPGTSHRQVQGAGQHVDSTHSFKLPKKTKVNSTL